MDKAQQSVGRDLLDSVLLDDPPGVGMLMIDGLPSLSNRPNLWLASGVSSDDYKGY